MRLLIALAVFSVAACADLVPSGQVKVSVSLEGPGSVVSSPSGIFCLRGPADLASSGVCSSTAPATKLPMRLTARPAIGYRFAGWSSPTGSVAEAERRQTSITIAQAFADHDEAFTAAFEIDPGYVGAGGGDGSAGGGSGEGGGTGGEGGSGGQGGSGGAGGSGGDGGGGGAGGSGGTGGSGGGTSGTGGGSAGSGGGGVVFDPCLRADGGSLDARCDDATLLAAAGAVSANLACTFTASSAANLQALASSADAGAVICLPGGKTRLQAPIVVSRPGVTIQGLPDGGSILSGAVVVNGFSPMQGRFVAALPALPPPYDPGSGAAGVPCEHASDGGFTQECKFNEQLFVGNGASALWTRVDSIAAVTGNNTYFLQYDAGVVYLSKNPGGATVEVSLAPAAIRVQAAGVVVRHVTAERFATPENRGTIEFAPAAQGGAVTGTLVQDSHGVGVAIDADGVGVFSSRLQRNGQLGLAGSARLDAGVLVGPLVAFNTIAFNNTAHFRSADGAAGGLKAFHAGMAACFNTVSANRGVGLWADGDSRRVIFAGNTAADNESDGVRFEISRFGVIHSNDLKRNGLKVDAFDRPAGCRLSCGGAIDLDDAADVDVCGNTTADNRNELALLSNGRPDGYRPARVSVHHNELALRDGGLTGLRTTGGGDPALQPAAANTFVGNLYSAGAVGVPAFVFGTNTQTFAAWQSAGRDDDGGLSVR
ncbi:MAG: right-handed parallel beta-helix repeat-containing protein [Myxococcaceae bacterium]|nr:right-handed parallel beta-helix repeat-containing protein [Myxococcaceae bacterium]